MTPPIPNYDSGHSIEGGAASKVLRRFFRTDHMDFSTCSLTLPDGSTCADPSPVLRSYSSFSQAAAENGVSRIYNGFHYRTAVEAGIEHGSGSAGGPSGSFCSRRGEHRRCEAGEDRLASAG